MPPVTSKTVTFPPTAAVKKTEATTEKDNAKMQQMLLTAISKASAATNLGGKKVAANIKKVLSLEPRVTYAYIDDHPFNNFESKKIFDAMLASWQLSRCRMSEIWAVEIFTTLEKFENLKKFAPEFARYYLQMEIALFHLHQSGEYKNIQVIPNENGFVLKSESLNKYLVILEQRIRVVILLTKDSESLIALRELIDKIILGKKGLHHELTTKNASFGSYIQASKKVKYTSSRIKQILSFNLEKMRLLERALIELKNIQMIPVEEGALISPLKFNKELHTFKDSLIFPDFLSYKKKKYILHCKLCEAINICTTNLKTLNVISEEQIGGRVVYWQSFAIGKIIKDVVFFDSPGNVEPELVKFLFPSAVLIELIYKRILHNVSSYRKPSQQNFDKLDSTLSAFEREIPNESFVVCCSLRKKLTPEIADSLIQALSHFLQIGLDGSEITQKMKPFISLITDVNSFLSNLASIQEKHMEKLYLELKKIPHNVLRAKKESLLASLEKFYFQVHLDLTTLIMIFKDIEIVKDCDFSNTYVEYESDFIPDELTDFLSPDFQGIIDKVIAEKDLAATTAAGVPAVTHASAASGTAASMVTSKPVEVVPAPKFKPAENSQSQVKTDPKQSQPMRPQSVVSVQSEILKIRRGEKRRKVLAKLREFNRYLPLDEENGKGSHLKLTNGRMKMILPHKKHVKTGIGHKISKTYNTAASFPDHKRGE